MRIIVMTDDGQYVSEIQFNKDPHEFLEQMVRESLIEMRIIDQGYDARPMPLDVEDVEIEEEEEKSLVQTNPRAGSQLIEILLENVIREGDM